MGKALGDQKTSLVYCGESFAVPLQKGGRTLPDIHSNIVNLAAKATDDFAFSIRRVLEMQTADSPSCPGTGMVDLGDWFFPSNYLEFFGAKEATEKTPLVIDGLSLHDPKPI